MATPFSPRVPRDFALEERPLGLSRKGLNGKTVSTKNFTLWLIPILLIRLVTRIKELNTLFLSAVGSQFSFPFCLSVGFGFSALPALPKWFGNFSFPSTSFL